MDVRMDVRKFTPVSYRTSALWGRCPKRGEWEEGRKVGIERKKKEEREELEEGREQWKLVIH